MRNSNKTLAAIITLVLFASVCFAFIDASKAEAASDDWPMFHHDTSHSGYSKSNAPLNSTIMWQFNTSNNHISSTPSVVNGRLYVGSDNGNMYCLNASTGKQIWINIHINGEVTSSPAVVDNHVYFGCGDFNVYCLDAQTGAKVWNYKTGNSIHSSPTVTHGYVYVGSADSNLYCLNAQTGEKKWSYTTVVRGPTYDMHTDLGPVASALSSPAVDNGYVFVGGTSLFCLKADSGSLVWSYPALTFCSPTVSEGKVYFLDYYGVAYCLNEATGSLVWSKPGVEQNSGNQYWTASQSSPAIANGAVYFGGFGVRALNTSTGAKIWSLNDITPSSPALADGHVYIGLNGTVWCLNAGSGGLVWSGTTWDWNNYSPIVVDGVIYIGGNAIYAFGTQSQTNSTPTAMSNSVSNPILIVMVLAITSSAIILSLVYLSRKHGTQTQPILKKRFSTLIAVLLIVIVSVSSLVVLYGNNLSSPTSPSTQPIFNQNLSHIAWKINLEHFANDIAYDNGKVFISTNSGVYAYDEDTGSLLWGGEGGRGDIQIYKDRVYVGGYGSIVDCLNESTGKTIHSFSAPVWSSYHSKSNPDFYFVADDRVLVVGDATAVYDTNTGLEFWEATDRVQSWDTFPLKPIIIIGPALARGSSYPFILGASRIDPNNGETIWTAEGVNYTPAPPIVVDNKVIFWDSTPNKYAQYDSNRRILNGNNILCVDADSGKTLWNFDVGTLAYQPTVYKDVLLFGAQDGNFYALHLTDGSIAWKTKVDTQNLTKGENLPAQAKSNSVPVSSQAVVDTQKNVVSWSFLITQSQINGINDNNLYVGVLASLDMSDGTILQTTNIQRNGSIYDYLSPKPVLGLSTLKNTAYLTAQTDLWIINQENGKILQIQGYDHTTISPLLANNKVFVATDLYLTAYD